ncbi:MAG: FkbM family methyltransferase [Chitinophagaceae bacterium]|nr:MAG: FkbM family methyltransferase [Chitinophagaceae bacterium]
MNRIRQISGKLLFCIKICADVSSFVKLVISSKKYDRYQRSSNFSSAVEDAVSKSETTVLYRLKIDGIRNVEMRTYEGDLQMFYEVFFERAYATDVAKNKQPLTIIDAGSNIGLSALFFLDEFETDKIFCIEPDGYNLKLLHKNLRNEVVSGKAKIIEAALSNTDGNASWHHSSRSYNSRLDTSEASELTVKTLTLNSIINEEQIGSIDILKIDIEGAEKLVFEGDASWMTITKNIIIEIHGQAETESIPALLRTNGFHVTKLENMYSSVFFATKS